MNEMDWGQYDKALNKASKEAAEVAREGAQKDGVPIVTSLGGLVKEYSDSRRAEIVTGDNGEKEVPLV
jgi:hypothetical protein